MRRASACFSPSNQPGLRSPRGARRRTVKLHVLPASISPRRDSSSPQPSYQARRSLRPRRCSGTDSERATRNRKRVRSSSCSGSPTTRPVITTSERSCSTGSCSDSAHAVCSPHSANPASSAPGTRTASRRPSSHAAIPASRPATSQPAAGSAGSCSASVAPATSAAASGSANGDVRRRRGTPPEPALTDPAGCARPARPG